MDSRLSLPLFYLCFFSFFSSPLLLTREDLASLSLPEHEVLSTSSQLPSCLDSRRTRIQFFLLLLFLLLLLEGCMCVLVCPGAYACVKERSPSHSAVQHLPVEKQPDQTKPRTWNWDKQANNNILNNLSGVSGYLTPACESSSLQLKVRERGIWAGGNP